MKNTNMYKEINQEPVVLRKCLETNLPEIIKLVARIREYKPNSIIMAARGTSCNATKYAKYIFETYCGIPVSISAPSVLTRYDGKLNLENTLVIGVSQSGAAEDVCSIIDRGNECGAITVSITNTENSLLATHAQTHINCYAGKEKSLAATKSFVAQMAILTIIAAYLSEDKYLMSCIGKLVDAVEEGLNKSEQISDLMQRYRFINECFILARGYGYPVALEMEIKIQETSFIRAQAFSIANFTHGPVAMLNKGIPVFVLANDKKTNDNVFDMLKRIKESDSDILLVTNEHGIAEKAGVRVLLLPEWCEGILGVFATIPVMQLIACELAVMRGNNPDSPAGLTKVTITR